MFSFIFVLTKHIVSNFYFLFFSLVIVGVFYDSYSLNTKKYQCENQKKKKIFFVFLSFFFSSFWFLCFCLWFFLFLCFLCFRFFYFCVFCVVFFVSGFLCLVFVVVFSVSCFFSRFLWFCFFRLFCLNKSCIKICIFLLSFVCYY